MPQQTYKNWKVVTEKENDLETRVLALIAKSNNITMSQIGQRETLYFG